jgi:predicted RNA-binding Zn-ribbon protein involved in translation (DUF1610 family)
MKELERNDHLLCLTCGYPLDGLPVEHRCPECGTAFRADEVRSAWKHWVFCCELPARKRPRGR